MTEISKKEFLTCVSKSRVIELEPLKKWIVENRASDANELAAKLVRDKLITKWQAKYLMTGRTRLDIGNYRLLERIQRDELGDRFLAIHKQLGRKVDIQVLPANLTEDRLRCEAFIKKVSETAKLDHRHLKHVYDIDQEGGRYFLVTEYCDGVTLDQTRREGLSLLGLARIVNQTVSGLEFAREHNVAHGDLSQQDILISHEEGVKVQNLAISPLRVSINPRSNSEEYECDLRALGAIGMTVLREITSDGETDVDGLQNVFKSLKSTDAAAQSDAQIQLANWLASHDYESSEETFESISFDENEINSAETVAAQRKSRFEPSNARRATRSNSSVQPDLRPAETESPEQDYYDDEDTYDANDHRQSDFLSRMAVENPVGLIATVMVFGLILIVGLGYGVFSLFGKKTSTSAVNAADQSGFPQSLNESGATNETVEVGVQKISLGDLNSINAHAQNLNPRPVDDHPDSAAVATPTTNLTDNTANEPTETTDKKDETPPAVEPEPKIITPEIIPPEIMQPEVGPEETAPSPMPEPAPEPTPATDPFEKFPNVTSLPPLNDTQETKIADLIIDDRFLLGAEIFAHRKIARARVLIEMNRSEDNEQKWVVTTRRNERNKPEPIATFRKSDSEFLFQWLPDAENNRHAGYLQNCLIKLEIPEKSTWLKLREPVSLEPMKLTRDSMSAEIGAELEYLPNPEIVAVEILPTTIPESKLNPALLDLEHNIPGRILLSTNDQEPFVWIQVAVDVKPRFVAKTNLVLFVSVGNIQPLKNLSALDDVAVTLKQHETTLYAKHETAVNTKAQPGQGEAADKIRAQLKKAFEDAQVITAKAIEYKSLAAKALNQPIGIRVFAKVDGHEIEIARTKDSAE